MMIILIAIFTGANIVLCRFLNAGSSEKNGLNMSTLMNYITGLLTSLLVLWFSGEVGGFRLEWNGVSSLVIYAGGTVGMITILLSNYLTPRLPAFLLTLLIFVSQLLTALLLDFFLTGFFSMGKLVGGLLVLIGLLHYQWVHRRYASSGREAMIATSSPDLMV